MYYCRSIKGSISGGFPSHIWGFPSHIWGFPSHIWGFPSHIGDFPAILGISQPHWGFPMIILIDACILVTQDKLATQLATTFHLGPVVDC